MKKITRIVTFYEDGTFTESTPSPHMPTTPAPMGPYMPSQPLNPNTVPCPWVTPQWPQNPWYTLTCKAEDNQPL